MTSFAPAPTFRRVYVLLLLLLLRRCARSATGKWLFSHLFFFLIGGAAGVNLYGERGGSSFLGSLRFWGEWRSLELIGPLPGLRYACSGVGRGKQDLLGFREWLREAAAQLALSLLGVPGSIRTFRQRASGSEDMKLGMPLKDKRKVTGVILRAAIRPRTLSQ